MSMTNTHTTACGTEPFDKNYCIGYQVHHEDWSPFRVSITCARHFWMESTG